MLLLCALAGCDGQVAIPIPPPVDMAAAAPTDGLASACPNDYPNECPPPAPNWDGGVELIIAQRCVPCHEPGGIEFMVPLTTYAEVYAQRGLALEKVMYCYMPPPDAGQLDPAERRAFLAWFSCGAPNN
jgi:hypothetical protein